MKVTLNVECTPEEARVFLGLPDVQPMQQALMAKLEDQVRANMDALAPDAMVKTWLPAGIQGAEAMQKMFWNQMQQLVKGFGNGSQAQVTFTDSKTPDQKTG